MTALVGIALWALIPGFIAKKKGRSFWGYYFLSFVITPLITMIITLCLRNISLDAANEESLKLTEPTNTTGLSGEHRSFEHPIDNEVNSLPEENQSSDPICTIPPIQYCRKCGFKLIDESDFCSNCGTPIEKR